MNQNSKFMDTLKVPTQTMARNSLSNTIENEFQKYNKLYKDEDVLNYFHHIIAAILLEYRKRYPDYTIETPYRVKSIHSLQNKLEKYCNKSLEQYKENPNIVPPIKEIKDQFALKIISYDLPPLFYHKDPEIADLIDKKDENHRLLAKMQEFKSTFVVDEYSTPIEYKFDECTKYDYYTNCQKLLDKILELIPEEASNPREHYKERLSSINNCISLLEASNEKDALITLEEITDRKTNFIDLLEDFTSRVHDKLDLVLTTKQLMAMFSGNELFEELGISVDPKVEEKRTKSGYVANFLTINTLFGPVECQLQSKHNYEEGNNGRYTAHSNMIGKFKTVQIPTDLENQKKINDYIAKIKEITPKSFLSRIDSTDQDRVSVQQFSSFQNYENLIGQVAKGDPCEKYIKIYLDKARAVQQIYKQNMNNNTSVLQDDLYDSFLISTSDIEEYIKSDEFKDFKERYSKNTEQVL